MFGLIAEGDRRLMRLLNRWEAPQWVRRWMVLASRAGDGWLWGTIAFILLLFGGPVRLHALIDSFVALGTAQLTFFTLKRIIGRERPCSIEPHCWSVLLPPDRFSFPSGHAITAFAIATALGLCYPTLLIGLLFCALSVAASRVILGLHYLSDVVAGLAIGILIGIAAFLWTPPL